MPTDTEVSFDDNYLAKFTADEVGDDIDTKGHVEVTPETATQDPFTVKGSLAIALDDAIEEPDETVKGFHDNNAVHTPDLPHQKDLSELSGEIEGVEEGTRMGEDKAVAVKDSLAEALDSIVQDTGPNPDEVPDEGAEEIDGKPVSSITGKPGDDKAPNIPESLGGDDKPDENGLVYITKVFTVDPEKYVSNNYRPTNAAPKTAQEVAKQASENRKQVQGNVSVKEEADIETLGGKDAELSAQQPDEPSAAEEKVAAKEAEKIQAGKGKEEISVEETVKDKTAQDEEVSHDYSVGRWVAFPNVRMSGLVRKITGKPESNFNGGYAYPCESPDLDDSNHFKNLYLSLDGVRSFATRKEAEEFLESKSKSLDDSQKKVEDGGDESIVFDYAEFIDGSSFLCFDEISGIDYTKIAMDAGPKKKVTKENCQTTFAQCRAKNPLFCRFHGPKLLEADIKSTLKTLVGAGCVVSVTKDKESKNPFTFRLTVGCSPHQKATVEMAIHKFMTQNPGISSGEEWHQVGKNKQTQEFEMDLLKADKPPEFKKVDNKETQAIANVKKMKALHKDMDVVGETAPALEKKAQQKIAPEKSPSPELEQEWAGLLHDVNHSYLLNSDEFIEAYKGDAKDFDAAYEKKDAEGMKNAVEALKGHMDEFTKKMEEAKQEQGKPEKTKEKEKKPVKAAKSEPIGGGSDDGGNTEGLTPSEQQKPVEVSEKETGTEAPTGVEGAVSEPETNQFGKPEKFKGSSVKLDQKAAEDYQNAMDNYISSEATDDDHVSAMANMAKEHFGHMTSVGKQLKEAEDAIEKVKEQIALVPALASALNMNLLEKTKSNLDEEYNSAIENLNISVQELNDSIEQFKKHKVEQKKARAASVVENAVKSLSRHMFPNGKKDGIDSVKDLLDSSVDSLYSLGDKDDVKSVLALNDVLTFQKDTETVAQDFDKAISDFKDKMDSEEQEGESGSVSEAATNIAETGKVLKSSYEKFKAAVNAAKEQLEAKAKIKEQIAGLKSSQGQGESAQQQTGGSGKFTKEQWDSMSVKDKVEAACKFYTEKLKTDPDNQGFQAKLQKAKMMYKKIFGKDF